VATFVLIPGAWHGGWCWQGVSTIIEAKQHKVFAVTLTGLCEKSHLLGPTIDLKTHIMDVVNFIKWRELRDVVLVAHSYSGMVVPGVAELMEEKISSITLVDAFYPKEGQRLVDLNPRSEAMRSAAEAGALSFPPISAELFRVNVNDRAWVDSLCTPHPIRTLLDPIQLTGARERIKHRRYIRSTDYPAAHFDKAMAEAGQAGWETFTIEGGHDLMLDLPEKLASLLMQDDIRI
jgi:pimeloyl-ACP methyl ester carboxylesterase